MDTPLQDRWDAILFDFDGVICDSNGLKGEAFAALYEDEGPEIQAAIRAFHNRNGGMPRHEKLSRFERDVLGRPLDERRIAALADRFAAAVEQAVVRSTPIPGAAEFLAAHSGRLPLFVISATPHAEMVRIVAGRGWTGLFTEVFGSPPGKADTAASIIGRHGLRRERVAFVGDAVQDHDAATALGLPFVGVRDRDGSHPFPEGTRVIDDLRALERVLLEWPR